MAVFRGEEENVSFESNAVWIGVAWYLELWQYLTALNLSQILETLWPSSAPPQTVDGCKTVSCRIKHIQ